MSDPPIDGSVVTVDLAWVFFISALLWIPLTILFFYLYLEHQHTKQYPQNAIILLLSCCCVCRTLWYFIYPQYGQGLLSQLLSRFAMLFQFSAMTYLMLMWGRALTLSTEYDKAIKRSSGQALKQLLNSTEVENIKAKMATTRKREIAQLIWRICLTINVIAYVTVVATTCFAKNDTYYAVNIIFLAFLCLIVAFGMLYVGFRNWFVLRENLDRRSMLEASQSGSQSRLTSTGSSTTTTQPSPSGCEALCAPFVSCLVSRKWYCLYGILGFIFNLDDLSKRATIQVRILRTLFAVSMLVSCFFTLRCLCFLYRPVVEDLMHQKLSLSSWIWPYFFYQFPEFFPNVIVAYAISPPNGVLRKWGGYAKARFAPCCGGDGKDRSKEGSVNRSVFSIPHSTFSPSPSTSVTPTAGPDSSNRFCSNDDIDLSCIYQISSMSFSPIAEPHGSHGATTFQHSVSNALHLSHSPHDRSPMQLQDMNRASSSDVVC